MLCSRSSLGVDTATSAGGTWRFWHPAHWWVHGDTDLPFTTARPGSSVKGVMEFMALHKGIPLPIARPLPSTTYRWLRDPTHPLRVLAHNVPPNGPPTRKEGNQIVSTGQGDSRRIP